MRVDLFADPSCPWCWTAFRWLRHRPGVEVAVRPFSLLLRDGTDGKPPAVTQAWSQAHAALRVLAAVEDDALRASAYDAVGRAMWEGGGTADPAAVLAAAGLPPAALAAAAEQSLDATIRDSMAQAVSAMGGDPHQPIPVLVLQDGRAVHGPLLTSVPEGSESDAVWAAVQAVACVDGLVEVSRARPARHPLVAARLASTRPSA